MSSVQETRTETRLSEDAKRVARAATANPSDDINRIIIGLGGQGSRVVNEVRKEVLKQGSLAAGLEFIAIDSDRVALSNLDSVPEDQRVHLAAPDDNITETIVPWLPHEFRPKAGGGCGMQRLTGKAMYLVHRHRILETVRAVARKLRQRTQVSNFMVVVVNAFGGGTGSGMTIDFSLDVRADLKEITGQEPVMFGVGILPSRAETIQRANGVALIKELHFLLSNKEPIVIGGRDYSSPFELFFLVGREVMGIERDDDVLQSIVRFTIDLGLIPSSSREHSAAGKGAGWVDLQDIRTLVKGAGHMFSTFGYYRAVFPAEDLVAYFETLDDLAKLRKEMPSLATDLDAARRGLEDKKIELAHLEELWRKGKARADRLRSDGILGANRPDLAKLLADLAQLEDDIRKLRKEIAELERTLPNADERRASFEKEQRDLEVRAESLLEKLTAPTQGRATYTVPLSREEVEHLSQNRHLLDEGNFRSVMEALGRLPDYHDKTMEMVGKNKILYLPLINYRMAFHTAAEFPPDVLAALRKHGFVRFDQAGNPVVSDDHLWMVMAMLSSRPENVDSNKVSARAFKEVVEGHVARRAEVKIVPSSIKRWEVVLHSWLVGIQVSPVAPGYPPRLRELEWLMPEYEQVAREGGLAQHHAFLYGDPLAFSQLTSVPVDRADVPETNERVTDFWAQYAPIETSARWLQLPPVLAETLTSVQDLEQAAAAVGDAIDEFRTGEPTQPALDRLGGALAQNLERVHSFQRAFSEEPAPLKERLSSLTQQLATSREAPKDKEKLIAMEELAAEALEAVSAATTLLTDLRTDLPESMGRSFAAARESQAAAGDASARRLVRWEHAVAQAEARVAELHATLGTTLVQLSDLERALESAQELLRAKTLPPMAGRLPRAGRRAPRLAVEMEAGHNGNGNRAHATGGSPEAHQEEME